MYRAHLAAKDRSGAIAAVAAIHAALLLAFLHMSGTIDLGETQRVLRVFDVDVLKPPPPPPPRPTPQSRPRQKEGGAAPKNIKSEATPVVAPKPRIETPPVQKIAATETPRQGVAATRGASTVRGPGTGAGGAGTGTGSGAGGNGPGGGGDQGVAVDARLITPRLSGHDYPRELLQAWPRGAPVFVGLRINPGGTVSECKIFRSSGNPAIDSETCNLAHLKFRFRPALNRFGQPIASWKGYVQEPQDR